MDLSVLSVLARSDKDPWAEAARLASVPRAAAVDSLADTIASLPDGDRSRAEAAAISRRLVSILTPEGSSSAAPPADPRARNRKRIMILVGGTLGAAMALAILLLDVPASWVRPSGNAPGVPTAATVSATRGDGGAR